MKQVQEDLTGPFMEPVFPKSKRPSVGWGLLMVLFFVLSASSKETDRRRQASKPQYNPANIDAGRDAAAYLAPSSQSA